MKIAKIKNQEPKNKESKEEPNVISTEEIDVQIGEVSFFFEGGGGICFLNAPPELYLMILI